MSDIKKYIKKFNQFFEEYCIKQIKLALSGKLKFVTFDFNEFLEFDPELYEMVIEWPENAVSLIKSTLKQYEEEGKEPLDLTFINLPETERVNIGELRTADLNRFYCIRGMIKRKSDVLPRLKEIHYLCTNPSCTYSDNILRIPQIEDTEQTIKCCPKCKSGVELTNKVQEDYQTMVLEEIPEDVDNGDEPQQPKSKRIILQGKLTTTLMDNKMSIGSKIEVIGFVRERSITKQNKKQLTSEIVIECLNVQLIDEKEFDTKLSSEELKQITSYAKRKDIYELLTNSYGRSLISMDTEKLALLCSVVGASNRTNKDKKKIKNKIHVLLAGDPSTAKSQLLAAIRPLIPRVVYTSGENASGTGLTAMAVKDESTGAWTAEAGAMVQANKGVLHIDEFDKLPMEEQTKLNTGMEDQMISLSKANLNVALNADAAVQATANPKNGSFDRDKDLLSQVRIQQTVLSRFDLVFVLLDKVDKDTDEKILDAYYDFGEDEEIEFIDQTLMRKYLFVAQKANPTMPKEVYEIIKEYVIGLRQKSKFKSDQKKFIRQMIGFTRICEAMAKLSLSKKVQVRHVKKAKELFEYVNKQYDFSEAEIGMSATKKTQTDRILSIIGDLGKTDSLAPYDKILERMQALDSEYTSRQLDRILEDLKKEMVIYAPKVNRYKLI